MIRKHIIYNLHIISRDLLIMYSVVPIADKIQLYERV